MEELKELIERKKNEEAVADTEPPPPPPGSVLARLRSQISTYSAQLAAVRREHAAQVNTLATELVAMQDDLIKALEARLEVVEVKNRNLLNDLDDAHIDLRRVQEENEKLELDRSITAEMAPAQET